MITDNMRAWGLVFASELKSMQEAEPGLSFEARAFLASNSAQEVFPLERAELDEVRKMMGEGRLPELLDRLEREAQ